jgi:hypothetical protein
MPVSRVKTSIKVDAIIEVSEGKDRKWHTCLSKGVVEEQILDEIRSIIH